MYLAAHRLWVLRLMGHGLSDQLGPICHSDARGEVALAWYDLLSREITDWDLLLADELPGGVDWPTALGDRSDVPGESSGENVPWGMARVDCQSEQQF